VSNPVPRLRRLLAIIPLIQRRGGISLKELQETLGVSKRELQGDLNAIMLCGVPPYLPNDYISVFIDGDHVTVDYAAHFSRPARLTVGEALALRLALERLPVPEEGPLYDAWVELLDALDRVMRRSGQGRMSELEGRIEATRLSDLGEQLRLIDEAVAARRPLELTYFSASSDTVSRRRVRPYGHGNKYGNHYLIGLCEQNQDERTFRLDRISELRVVEDAPPCEPPAGFDPAERLEGLGGSDHSVRLRFAAAIERFVREDYAEQRCEKAEGGDVVVTLQCGSLPWAVRQALLYGELCEILEPPEARQELVSRLQAYLGEG
jgi:proteasome accessory factor C